MPPRPEAELLLACARTPIEPWLPRVRVLLAGEINWTYLVRTALNHGVSPLLAEALERAGSDGIPEAIGAALREHLADNRARTLALVEALFEVLDALGRWGVPAIPFKGPTLGALAYGDMALRRAGDLDFLVPKSMLDPMWEALVRLGYRELTEHERGYPLSRAEDAAYRRYQCEYAFVRTGDGVVVEPHWALAPTMMAVDLDYAALWARARSNSLLGQPVTALALEDLLLALCVHASKHEWTQLRWIADVAQLVDRQPGLDLVASLERARVQGCLRMLLVGLALSGRVLGLALPGPVAAALSADREARRLVEEVAARLFREPMPRAQHAHVTRFRLAARERLRDRVRYAVRTIGTPRVEHVAMAHLPARLYWLGVPVKLAHDYAALPVWRAGREVARAARAVAAGQPWAARGRRLLLVDWVPHLTEGAGLPRMNRALWTLARAGYEVTLHPVDPCVEPDAALYRDLPRPVEVIRERGLDDLEDFLVARAAEFGVIVVSGPAAMAQVGRILARRPGLLGRARLVYDAEALSCLRDIRRRRLAGEAVDEATAERLMAAEVALARPADAVAVVSRAEQELFRRYGARNVHILAHCLTPCPGPAGFAERAGLLFVGRLAEDGWPNTDALVWFRDQVWPEIRAWLRAAGQETIVTVAGRMGARALADPAEPTFAFLGAVSDLGALYDRARVFIAPTRFAAGLPHKVHEAAAHGVPVVATRLLADQLGWQPGRDLLAAEVGDARGFAEHVAALYTDPDLWARLRQSALARVAEDCSPERFHRALLTLLHGPRRHR